MYKSLREYILVVSGRWWAMISGIVSTIIGIISSVKQGFVIPSWVWFVMAIVCLSIAEFLAFHKVRQERDEAKGDVDCIIQKLKSLKITIGGREVDLAKILYELRDGLALKMTLGDVIGVMKDHFGKADSDIKLIEDTRSILRQLSLNQIIQSTPRQEASGRHSYDVEYWVLTDLGKKVINNYKGG